MTDDLLITEIRRRDTDVPPAVASATVPGAGPDAGDDPARNEVEGADDALAAEAVTGDPVPLTAEYDTP